MGKKTPGALRCESWNQKDLAANFSEIISASTKDFDYRSFKKLINIKGNPSL